MRGDVVGACRARSGGSSRMAVSGEEKGRRLTKQARQRSVSAAFPSLLTSRRSLAARRLTVAAADYNQMPEGRVQARQRGCAICQRNILPATDALRATRI